MRQLRNLALVTLFLAAPFTAQSARADFPLEVSDAPTDNLKLTLSAIQSAKSSIYLNIYELSSPEIAPAPAPWLSMPAATGPTLTASAITRVSSPDSSLSGLVALMDGAQSTLDIEQMTFDSNWKNGSNPMLDAVQRAAARGVRVRVLLNDESVFNHSGGKPSQKNRNTTDFLNGTPNVTARIANLPAMGVDYIHNKGALVDGRFTLVSSINWDQNSITRNREAAVLIESREVNAHYQALFNDDWEKSTVESTATSEQRPTLFPTMERMEALPACPENLYVSIRIGHITSADNDGSFASLSQSTVSGSFRRSPAKECVYVSEGNLVDTVHKRFLELHYPADGSATFVFEGFTPHGNKIYTVRAKLARHIQGSGDEFQAAVFNGSATHEFLGTADVRVHAP